MSPRKKKLQKNGENAENAEKMWCKFLGLRKITGLPLQCVKKNSTMNNNLVVYSLEKIFLKKKV